MAGLEPAGLEQRRFAPVHHHGTFTLPQDLSFGCQESTLDPRDFNNQLAPVDNGWNFNGNFAGPFYEPGFFFPQRHLPFLGFECGDLDDLRLHNQDFNLAETVTGAAVESDGFASELPISSVQPQGAKIPSLRHMQSSDDDSGARG